LEHAYQHRKAEFFGMVSHMEKIRQAPTAAAAHKLGKEVSHRHRYDARDGWDKSKMHLMGDLLSLKAEQCPLFRTHLMESGDKLLTFNVPDRHWGSDHMRDGEKFVGENMFARALVKVRSQLLLDARKTGTSRTALPTPQRQDTPPVSTANRFSPLRNVTPSRPDPSPSTSTSSPQPPRPVPPPAPSPSPSPQQRQKRRRIGSPRNKPSVAGPFLTTHRVRDRWRIPVMHSDVVVLGDSNLSRATDYGTQVRSIEFHSYPGATIKHLAQLMDPKFSPKIPQKQ